MVFCLGLSESNKTTMMSSIGISITVGRLVSGALGDLWLHKMRAAHYGVSGFAYIFTKTIPLA